MVNDQFEVEADLFNFLRLIYDKEFIATDKGSEFFY
jgi:hypothetical protein